MTLRIGRARRWHYHHRADHPTKSLPHHSHNAAKAELDKSPTSPENTKHLSCHLNGSAKKLAKLSNNMRVDKTRTVYLVKLARTNKSNIMP